MPDFDLFISYRRRDAERVLPLVAALRERGVFVWLDQHAIGEFGPITDEIRHGLAQSKALLAWYSEDYPTSRPCQMELTAALLAAHREGDPRRRIIVINPERSGTHIEPLESRDAQYAVAPSDAAAYATLADRIAAHLAALSGPLGGILAIVPPVQYGLTLTGAIRFVGRLPELWRIHSALHASESAIISGTSAPGLAIVSGFGGIGKSLLAEEYALRFGAAYPGGIFWLRAHGHDATGDSPVAAAEAGRLEQFMAMAIELGIADLDPRQVRTQLRATLVQNREPFLWVVDDLASGLDAEAVKAWLAPAPHGKTLVTTRSRAYTNIGHETSPVRLGVLTPAEAFDLLRSHRRPVGATEEAAAHDITQDLGYHALAVVVAGAALAAHAGLKSFVEFRRDLAHPREDELELAAELAGVLPSGHEPSVAATILRSVRHLPEEGRDVLRLAALLAVAPIPPALVASTFAHVDHLADRDAKRRAIHGLDQVERASLAERGDGDARLVHALVSRTMRFRDDKPDRREALRAAVVAALRSLLPEVVSRSFGGAPPEVQHARALSGLGDLWDLDTLVLAAWVASHDHQRGLYAMARRVEERVLEARRRVQGEDHPDTLSSMNNLAMTLRAQGDLAGARGLHERALKARRRVLGEDHPDTLSSMNNLGLTLAVQGDLTGARGWQERALEAQRRVLGDDHPKTLTSMNNLAFTLGVQGDLAGARGWQERVLEARRRVLGEDHPDTLGSMNNLGLTLGVQGDLAGARGWQERVLEAVRRVLGEDHPNTLAGMNNLGETLRAQGDLAGARGLHERALDARRRVLGEDHPDTLTSMNNLGETLRAQGALTGARGLHERALDAQRRVRGEDHPDTLTSMNNLALTLGAQRDLAGARGLHERALEAQRRVLGEDHPKTLTSMNNLAETLRAQGALTGARGLHERVLDARRRGLGEDHPDTLMSMNNLALTLGAQGDLAGAGGLLERVLEAVRRVLGEDHPNTLASTNNLAETLRAQGNLTGARGLHERVLEARRRVLGEDHSDTLMSMNNLALTLGAQGDLAGARGLLERVLEARRRVLGEDHPDTLTSVKNLGAILDLG